MAKRLSSGPIRCRADCRPAEPLLRTDRGLGRRVEDRRRKNNNGWRQRCGRQRRCRWRHRNGDGNRGGWQRSGGLCRRRWSQRVHDAAENLRAWLIRSRQYRPQQLMERSDTAGRLAERSRRSDGENGWRRADRRDHTGRCRHRANGLYRCRTLERTCALQRACPLERTGTLQWARPLERTCSLQRSCALQRTCALQRAAALLSTGSRHLRAGCRLCGRCGCGLWAGCCLWSGRYLQLRLLCRRNGGEGRRWGNRRVGAAQARTCKSCADRTGRRPTAAAGKSCARCAAWRAATLLPCSGILLKGVAVAKATTGDRCRRCGWSPRRRHDLRARLRGCSRDALACHRQRSAKQEVGRSRARGGHGEGRDAAANAHGRRWRLDRDFGVLADGSADKTEDTARRIQGELACLALRIVDELVDRQDAVRPDRQGRSVQEDNMCLVVRAGGDPFIGLHVVADMKNAFRPGRRQALRLAINDRSDADAGPRRRC